MFLIRTAFWLSLVILFIPGDPSSGEDAPRVGAFEAISAAQATVSDFGAFCERNPQVCSTGNVAFQVFADKARNGVRMISDYFDRDDAGADRGTLRDDDLEPVWRGSA